MPKPVGYYPPCVRCVHCQRRKRTRPRGLCHHCFPQVRDQYPPSGSKYARRGVGQGTGVRPLPGTPTPALPGSPEKVLVLAERAARGEALWHPRDGNS